MDAGHTFFKVFWMFAQVNCISLQYCATWTAACIYSVKDDMDYLFLVFVEANGILETKSKKVSFMSIRVKCNSLK